MWTVSRVGKGGRPGPLVLIVLRISSIRTRSGVASRTDICWRVGGSVDPSATSGRLCGSRMYGGHIVRGNGLIDVHPNVSLGIIIRRPAKRKRPRIRIYVHLVLQIKVQGGG